MTRPLRIEFPGAFYHVTSRGNKRQNIFENHEDRNTFINVFAKVIKTYGWRCFAFCLMDNHYHILIQTPNGDLSSGMRDLNGIYTQLYNQKHQTTGHILEGRYKAFVIEQGDYFLEVLRYTVLNPIRANVVKRPDDWPWSSYSATAYGRKMYPFIDQKFVLQLFSRADGLARERYRKFVQDGIDKKSPFLEARHGTLLGSDQFVMEIWDQYSESEEESEIKLNDRRIARPTLKQIFDEVMTKEDRNIAIELARMRCAYSITAIAEHIGLRRSTVSDILRQRKTVRSTT